MTTFTVDTQILWPMLPVVGLTFVSGFYMALSRIRAVRKRVMKIAFYRAYRNGEEPENMAIMTRHYTNLFETPVLFYLGCILASLMGPVSSLVLGLAWGFAGLRLVQSTIHLTSNNVKWRAYTFFTSWFLLVGLWASNVAGLINAV